SSFGGIWNVLSNGLRIVPRALRDPAYRWIARHRYRWFGRRDTCYLPQAEDRKRFLQ
ncbi:MAG: DCC1-like thiol-disulfide oxidoreductase family protein, partial [Rudaea sp.]